MKPEELRTPGGDHLTRIVQEIVSGKQITMAHIIYSSDSVIYQKLGLDLRVDYEHAVVGIVTMTPSETAIIATDICMKKSATEIGFIDRFSGTLIITGRMADVSVALKSALEYTETVMGLTVCNLTKAQVLVLKRIILIDGAECRKTTLTQALRGHKLQYHRTQAINRHDIVIDTSGEYAENRELARALILYSYEADVIALMLSSTEDYSLFSPNIAAGATRPVIGIVTQIDWENARPDRVESWPHLIECRTVSRVSTFTGEGIEEVLEYLDAGHADCCNVWILPAHILISPEK